MNKSCVYCCVIDRFVFPAIIDLFWRGGGDKSLNEFISPLQLKSHLFLGIGPPICIFPQNGGQKYIKLETS